MRNRNQRIAYIAVVAALYAALTYAQNLLLPGTATMADITTAANSYPTNVITGPV